MVVTTAFAALCISILMLYYRWENKRRDRCENVTHVENSEFFDLTDRENPEFRVSPRPTHKTEANNGSTRFNSLRRTYGKLTRLARTNNHIYL